MHSALGVALTLLLVSCRSPESTRGTEPQGPRADACLQGVTIKRLAKAIRACDAVVAAHPRNPQPRNERALLLSLAGRNQTACRDSAAAAELLNQLPTRPAPDPVLVEEIRLRQRTCKAWRASLPAPVTTPPVGVAPSAGTPAAPGR